MPPLEREVKGEWHNLRVFCSIKVLDWKKEDNEKIS